MTSVERDNLRDVAPFGCGDERGIHRSETEIPILGDQFCNAEPVLGCDAFRKEVSRREVSEESDLGVSTEPRRDEVGNFGDSQDRDKKRAGVCLEQGKAFVMVVVVFVDVCVQRAGVN